MKLAFDYYVAVEDAPKALAVTEYQFHGQVGTTGRVQLFAEALKLVAPDSHRAGRILAGYGMALSQELGDHEGAINELEQALAIAEKEDDSILKRSVLTTLADIQYSHSRYQDSLRNSLRAIQLIARSNEYELDSYDRPHRSAARALLALGDIEAAEPHAAAYLAQAEQHHDRFTVIQALHLNEVLAYLKGNMEIAREFSDRGLALDQHDIRILNSRAILEYEVGEFGRGDAYLDRLLEVMYLTPPGHGHVYAVVPLVIGIAAQITRDAGRSDIAMAAAEPVLSSPSLGSEDASYARTGLALLAVEQGDRAAADYINFPYSHILTTAFIFSITHMG